jgi:hypothetical protein
MATVQKPIKKAPKQEIKTNDPQLTEELKLIARGLSDEAIEQAKVIAKGKDIPLPEAIKDPLFAIYQKDAEEKRKKEDAKLGASKGSQESKIGFNQTQLSNATGLHDLDQLIVQRQELGPHRFHREKILSPSQCINLFGLFGRIHK